MANWIAWLDGQPWYSLLTTIGTVLGIISVIAQVVVHNRKKQKLVWYWAEKRKLFDAGVIQKTFPDFNASLNGESIDVLYVSYLTIRNLGKNIIKSSDIFPDQPIRIKLDASQHIYGISVDGESSNKCDTKAAVGTIPEKPNEGEVIFDYIEPKGEIVISVFHKDISGRMKGYVDGRLQKGSIAAQGLGYNDVFLIAMLAFFASWFLIAGLICCIFPAARPIGIGLLVVSCAIFTMTIIGATAMYLDKRTRSDFLYAAKYYLGKLKRE